MKKFPFELVENTDDQVILMNIAKTPLEVAKFPYVSGNLEYITVSKGEDNLLTRINNDGTTNSFSWGKTGFTIIGESSKELKNKVIDFIETENHILLGAKTTGKPIKCDIFHNVETRNLQWLLRFEYSNGDQVSYYSKDCANIDSAVEEAKKFNSNFVLSGKETSKWTGVDYWHVEAVEKKKETIIQPKEYIEKGGITTSDKEDLVKGEKGQEKE